MGQITISKFQGRLTISIEVDEKKYFRQKSPLRSLFLFNVPLPLKMPKNIPAAYVCIALLVAVVLQPNAHVHNRSIMCGCCLLCLYCSCQYFCFKHSSEYQKVQFQFLEAVETFDPNAIAVSKRDQFMNYGYTSTILRVCLYVCVC